MTHYKTRVEAIRDYFAIDGKKPDLIEMKALTKDDRDELAAGIIAEGHTIEQDK